MDLWVVTSMSCSKYMIRTNEYIYRLLIFSTFREVLDDYLLACETFPQDEAILTITEALQLSQDALSYDPDQLPSQLIGRLPDVPVNKYFPCRY